MAKRILINGRAETLLKRLVEQFRQDNAELEGTMSDGKAASMIVQALITWARLLCFELWQSKLSSRHDRLLLGEHIGKDVFRPLPELESFMRI